MTIIEDAILDLPLQCTLGTYELKPVKVTSYTLSPKPLDLDRKARTSTRLCNKTLTVYTKFYDIGKNPNCWIFSLPEKI